MDKVSYETKIAELSDVMVIIIPETEGYRVIAYVWNNESRECTKFEFPPQDFELALETAEHFIGSNPKGVLTQ